jgi:hypothetical protein
MRNSSRLRWRAPLRILDFGCGQSLVPDMLRDEGHRVIAVDLAPPLRACPDRLTGPLDALDLAPRGFDLASPSRSSSTCLKMGAAPILQPKVPQPERRAAASVRNAPPLRAVAT